MQSYSIRCRARVELRTHTSRFSSSSTLPRAHFYGKCMHVYTYVRTCVCHHAYVNVNIMQCEQGGKTLPRKTALFTRKKSIMCYARAKMLYLYRYLAGAARSLPSFPRIRTRSLRVPSTYYVFTEEEEDEGGKCISSCSLSMYTHKRRSHTLANAAA